MAELLLELLSEEIPARMQARAAEDLKRLVTEKLKAANLAFTRADAFVTPRRLALVVDGLPEQQPDLVEERKGPRVDAPEQAIQGFLKAAGLASLDGCEVRELGKAKFYFATQRKSGAPTTEVVPHLIVEALGALAWPKSMRWGTGQMRYVRPLQGIVAVFDGRPLDGVVATSEGAGIRFTNSTVGHRFLAAAPFAVSGAGDYETKLRTAKVILDPQERRDIIWKGAVDRAAAEGLQLREDKALLDEVAGLVEWPVVLMGAIDPVFMDLPPEVLTASMRAHQKYFTVLAQDGRLAPRFIVVANMVAEDGGAAIVAGNERVLRARLSDAKFFWDQDRKTRLEDRVPALSKIVFHEKLGTLGEKVERIAALAADLIDYIPGADRDLVRSAATLAKADLTSGMVGEFPELQGIMGRYYAAAEGERPEVADAIREHYAPLGPNDRCPKAPTSVAVALADKIDTLVGFFAIGEKPTGSKDPFALRRAALGIIRLILENGLRLPLRTAFERAAALHDEMRSGLARPTSDLLEFFADRLKVHLREQGVRHDLISAVFALGDEDDLVRLLARVDALGSFLKSEDGSNLLTAYKRAANIVAIEEKRDKARYDGDVDEAHLGQAEERTLHDGLVVTGGQFDQALVKEDFSAAMAAIAALRRPVDAFFDHVTVNCEDKVLRANRLRLLSQIRATLNHVADFSKVEG